MRFVTFKKHMVLVRPPRHGGGKGSSLVLGLLMDDLKFVPTESLTTPSASMTGLLGRRSGRFLVCGRKEANGLCRN